MLFHRHKTNITKLDDQEPFTREIAQIREIIAAAISHEQEHGVFLKVMRQNFQKMHTAIALMEGDSPEALLSFVVSYIRRVPDFIEAVNEIGEKYNIQPLTTPFLRIIEEFILSPPELVESHSGLAALLDEAYLAHRIIEEVNDHIMARFGIPLAPLDMTKANVVVHSLIGEPFANDLDHAVQYSVEMLLVRGSKLETYLVSDAFLHYVGQHQRGGWIEELAQFPCFSSDMAIDLRFIASEGDCPVH